MTEDFTTEACLYLLDELDAERRAAFSAHLARDPVARAAFKTCADALAEFALTAAPPEGLPPEAQRAMVAALLTEVADEVTVRKARLQAGRRRWRLVWPLAAALLLVLNAWQFWQGRQLRQTLAEASGETGFASGTDRRASATTGSARANPTQGAAGPKAGPGPMDPRQVTVELRRLEKLRKDYAALQHQRDSLSAEYDAIIRQLAQRALMEQGVGRLAAMELVDNASYARGERKGLINLAKRFLTEPGVVAVDPMTLPKTPDLSKPSVKPQSAPLEPPSMPPVDAPVALGPGGGQSAIATTATGDTGVMLQGATGGSTYFTNPTVTPTTPATPPTQPPPTTEPQPQAQSQSQPQASTDQSAAATQPYAWSVFDETEHQGYLNLYNLPTVGADQSLQLWVKPAGATEYQRVGEVPAQFYGGSGSLYYKLPETTATPAEILITQEPRKAPPAQPAGATVLRGP